MRVLIHPGFHKTGTTSLQRGAEAEHAVLAPRLRLVLPHDIEPVNFAARRMSVGANAKRIAAFRAAVTEFAQGIDPGDPRPLLVSSEHLCGLLPGRKSVTTYAAAPELLGQMAEVLSDQLPNLSLSVWFTTRAPEAWLKSLYWQLLRSQRVTEGSEQFANRFRDAADLGAIVAMVAERLAGQADVSSTRLEDCGGDPLGPLGVALDRLDAVVRNATEPDTGAACPDRFERLTFVEARGPDGAHAPLTATLDAGDRVLLDGRSGIGKSRLLAAIIGESPLAEGRIEIDGANIEGFSPSSLRRVITFLPQRPCLIRGTLRDNLRLGNDDPDDAALWRVLGVVGLADWAQGLDGLDTDLQETGCNLSGGMLQRITLARALLRSSQVYIFDESLSEIDADCCRTILSAIDTYLGDAICVFVAHAGPVRAMTFDRTLRLSAEESGAAFPESPARFVQAI